jgi:hypothetical protein
MYEEIEMPRRLGAGSSQRFHLCRPPLLSAMSLLNVAENEPHSYMEIADPLRQYGAKADVDSAQLWRRTTLAADRFQISGVRQSKRTFGAGPPRYGKSDDVKLTQTKYHQIRPKPPCCWCRLRKNLD